VARELDKKIVTFLIDATRRIGVGLLAYTSLHLEIVLVTGPGMFPIIDATLNTPTLTGRSAASSHR